jgi:hypothetical protein
MYRSLQWPVGLVSPDVWQYEPAVQIVQSSGLVSPEVFPNLPGGQASYQLEFWGQ